MATQRLAQAFLCALLLGLASLTADAQQIIPCRYDGTETRPNCQPVGDTCPAGLGLVAVTASETLCVRPETVKASVNISIAQFAEVAQSPAEVVMQIERKNLERILGRPEKRNGGLLRRNGPVSWGTKAAYVVCTELDLHSSKGGFETNALFRDGRTGGVKANLNRIVSYAILGGLSLLEIKQPEIAIVTTGVVAGGRCAVAAKNY